MITLSEKIYRRMLHQGLNQQRLAGLAGISDSEVSRILRGKSSPSLEYARRLAQALGVSLDFLADDEWEHEGEPKHQGTVEEAAGPESPAEREILELARGIGTRLARRVLEMAADLGPELAIRRLLDMGGPPIIEPEPVVQSRGGGYPASSSLERTARRATSA